MADAGAISAGSRGPSPSDGLYERRDRGASIQRRFDPAAILQEADRARSASGQSLREARRPDSPERVDRNVSQRGDDMRSVSARSVEMRREQRVGRRDGVPESAVSVPAADNLRSRMAIEASRSADLMTEMATQRALREYNAG